MINVLMITLNNITLDKKYNKLKEIKHKKQIGRNNISVNTLNSLIEKVKALY